MSDWLHNLPVPWLALVIFGFTCLLAAAAVALVATEERAKSLKAISPGMLPVLGFVHCDNRLASTIAMGLFATGVATAVLLIAAHDRPFAGQVSIHPEPLLQIMPDAPVRS